MPYVNVPNDLSKIKTKIAFNLTKRQLICFGIGAAIGVPTYLLTRQAIGNTGALFGELADPVRVHGDIGNGLLGGQRPVLICVFLLFCFAQ